MKKKLLSVLLTLMGVLFMISCSSDNDKPVVNFANTEILKVMVDNYYWDVPANPNMSLESQAFFGSLLNSADFYTVEGKKIPYSNISVLGQTSVSYELGFEYGTNLYSDGKYYYVIYYVKPNTNAANQGLKRGYLIESVNGEIITSANKEYLLKNAYQHGTPMVLKIADPNTAKSETFTFSANQGYNENPVYKSEIIPVTNGKVGYIVYNMFTSGANNIYDNILMAKLSEFNNLGVDYVVLDLRYNTGGGHVSAVKLGSALVKNRNINDAFLVNMGRLKNTPYNFVNEGNIPNLGNNLKKVYIITGKNTAGMGESLINGLRPYLSSNLRIAGEEGQGRNMATGYATAGNNTYGMTIAIGKWANKDLSSNYNTQPDIKQADTDKDAAVMLEPLGSLKEPILASVLSDITGQGTRSASSLGLDGARTFGGSLLEKSLKCNSSINLDEINN